MYAAIVELKPQHQTILTLRFFENLPFEQIAQILDISKSRAYQLNAAGIITNSSEAIARKNAPPSQGREQVVEIIRDGIRYVSVREFSNINSVPTATIYRYIRMKKIEATSYRGTFFIRKSYIIQRTRNKEA